MNKVTVSVPATTANLGVGFDCLGAALTLANEFQFAVVSSDFRGRGWQSKYRGK